MNPYVVRFTSLRSNVGKTFIASRVVAGLKSRGYVVGVIKHSAHGLDIEDKDSHVYLQSGADIVIASSGDLGIVYRRIWVDSLLNALTYTATPIVVVEGFKEANIGDVVIVSERLSEVRDTVLPSSTIACVVRDIDVPTESVNCKALSFNDIDILTNIIEDRALSYLYDQLPKTDCGYCGYELCRSFVSAYAKGLTAWCPRDSDVRFLVDGDNVQLNPYVKRVLRSIVAGFAESLKGVPKEWKRIIIEITR